MKLERLAAEKIRLLLRMFDLSSQQIEEQYHFYTPYYGSMSWSDDCEEIRLVIKGEEVIDLIFELEWVYFDFDRISIIHRETKMKLYTARHELPPDSIRRRTMYIIFRLTPVSIQVISRNYVNSTRD